MKCWFFMEVIIYHMTLLPDEKGIFKLAKFRSQTIQVVEAPSEEIEVFILLERRVTVQIVTNTT